MTLYRIGDIRPNPFRNIDRYPINREKVEKLKESIGRTDFWDNLVARIGADDQPEIGYGHHRMVALRELFPADHEISLIVRDLDDAAMLHVMADENMQEWAASTAVLKETVRAVRDFLADNGDTGDLGHGAQRDSIPKIAAFLGWPEWRVQDSLALINAEEAGTLKPEDTDGIALDTAIRLQRSVAKIKEPEVKRAAVARVRADLKAGRLAVRDIPETVRRVRDEYAPPPEPKVPAAIAKAIHADVEGFWRVAVPVNGRTFTRPQIIRLIAENRDADELTKTTYGLPWAEQIALALDEMAKEARSLAEVLRAESAVEVAS